MRYEFALSYYLCDLLEETSEAMARLTDLPEDIQFIIFRDLGWEEHVNLAQTHRALTIEAQRQLFRTVLLPVQSLAASARTGNPGPGKRWIDHHGPMDSQTRRRRALGPDYSGRQPLELPADKEQMVKSRDIVYEAAFARERIVQQFLQVITANPTLATFVRHVKLHAIWGSLNVFHTSMSDILNLLPNLGKMSVSLRDVVRGELWKDVQNICTKWLSQLINKTGIKTIWVETCCLPIINKILQLETLQEFEYTGSRHFLEHRGREGPTDFGQWIDTLPGRNLRSIRLDSLELHSISIRRLFTHTTSLTKLSFCFGNFIHDVGTLPNILSEVRNTLQVLEVFEPPSHQKGSTAIDEHVLRNVIFGKADFTQFYSLRVLKISSALWFNSTCRLPKAASLGFSSDYENRSGAYQLLPASIEDLEIQFNLRPGVFGMCLVYRIMFIKQLAEKQIDGYDWILEFVQNRHVLPNLKSLRLVGNPSIWVDEPYEKLLASYQPPQPVQEAFDNANVTLQFHLLGAE